MECSRWDLVISQGAHCWGRASVECRNLSIQGDNKYGRTQDRVDIHAKVYGGLCGCDDMEE